MVNWQSRSLSPSDRGTTVFIEGCRDQILDQFHLSDEILHSRDFWVGKWAAGRSRPRLSKNQCRVPGLEWGWCRLNQEEKQAQGTGLEVYLGSSKIHFCISYSESLPLECHTEAGCSGGGHLWRELSTWHCLSQQCSNQQRGQIGCSAPFCGFASYILCPSSLPPWWKSQFE